MNLPKEKDWMKKLSYTTHGDIQSSMENIGIILRYDDNLKNLVYNESKKMVDIIGGTPWIRNTGGWSNTDFSCLQMYLENTYHIYAPRKCQDALYATLSNCKRHHPIRSYLDRLEWDGTKRIDWLLVDYLGAEENDYVRAVTRKTLTGAVARIYEPGTKFDHMLVLCGEQGIGKSTLFSKLGKSWYSDSMNIADMKDKSAAEKLQGIWIMELSELAGIRKVDVETVKSFLSRQDDQYRAPYQTYVEAHPRCSIIVGTTNTTDGFLRDITGNRRFWPVMVSSSSSRKTWTINDEEVDQIWAEAVFYYRQKEPLYLESELSEQASFIQLQAMETDPRQGLIGEYLDKNGCARICLMELWCECLGKERSDFKRGDAFELEGMLLKIGGWKPYDGNNSGKMRLPGYGVQKTFIKTGKDKGND